MSAVGNYLYFVDYIEVDTVLNYIGMILINLFLQFFCVHEIGDKNINLYKIMQINYECTIHGEKKKIKKKVTVDIIQLINFENTCHGHCDFS